MTNAPHTGGALGDDNQRNGSSTADATPMTKSDRDALIRAAKLRSKQAKSTDEDGGGPR